MRAAELNAVSNMTFYDECGKCGAVLPVPSILPECENCGDEDDADDTDWYAAELWIVGSDERHHHCWTATFTSAAVCREETLKHHRHNLVGRPRIYKVNDDGTKTFVEEIDARTPEQIAYSKQALPF